MGEVADPDVYVAAVTAVLSRYPMEVARLVCNPSGGLPSKLKWLPSIAEVQQECEAWHAPMRRLEESERDRVRQLEERERAEAPRDDRLSIDELKAKYGPTWGIGSTPEHENQAVKAESEQRASKFISREIQREYEAHGEEPVRLGPLLVSRGLIENVQRYVADPETTAAVARWKEEERRRGRGGV